MHDDVTIDGIHPAPNYTRSMQGFLGYIQAFTEEHAAPFHVGVLAGSALHANLLLALKSMRRRAEDSGNGNGIHIPAQVLNPQITLPQWMTRVIHP